MSIGPSSLGRRTHRALDVVHAREVAQDAHGAHAVRFGDRARDIGQRLRAAVLRGAVLAHAVHGDIAAESGQPLGEGATQPAAGARDERHLAFEHPISHGITPPVSRQG